jgi:UDP-N-acetylglucosamine diphosphorylase / glucose-1-phosphate thymidylyltransferase / UDP-N-acetylgalactosamine diphosphorylase / glucosamine-1-phosphate N-acetyltransferase / galactosamine-1-phosphate N-acetyltransferase
MKAIMMVAGRSTRTYPLTLSRPKPLLKVANRTIIEHNLESLCGIVDEVILVVGYMKEMLKEHLGDSYKKIRLTYVEQKEQLGTANAVLAAERHIQGKDKKNAADESFLVMYGDDIYSRKDILEVARRKNAVLAQKVKDPTVFGVFVVRKKRLIDVVEKPKKFVSDLANVGCFSFRTDFFSYLKRIKKSERGEYELTDAIALYAKDKKVDIVTVSGYWLPIGYPWNLLEANAFLLKSVKTDIKGEIEEHVTVKGELVLGKGSIIKSGTYIEGPVVIGENSIIGPHAYIRPDTTIGNNCRIRGELFDTIVMDNSTAKHNCYLGHSVLGEDVNIGAGTITSDYRHDGKTNITVVNGSKVDTGRRKLGSFMGDHVRTGINTTIYPGRKLWPNTGTLPGEIVTKDIIKNI